MMKFVVIGAAILLMYRWIMKRWPWESNVSTRNQALFRARRLLGVEERAGRKDIVTAHKRLVAMVHPDKGGTNEQVHEANAARDLLLNELPDGVE